jgi:hypothetical protein
MSWGIRGLATAIRISEDLVGVVVHKLNLPNQLYLLAYLVIKEESIELIMLGPHENYYRDLKTNLKYR